MSGRILPMFTHERSAGRDEWLTPREIIQAVGPFDLDPCAPLVRPWPTADRHYTLEDDGFWRPWAGRVWLNPPYGAETGRWMGKMAAHGDGVALVFARTDTGWWQDFVMPCASAVLFLRGRLTFCNVDGSTAPNPAGAPSALIAYGWGCAARIRHSGLRGAYVLLGRQNVAMVPPKEVRP